jgi:5-methylcytosine-specific restriction enzyme A
MSAKRAAALAEQGINPMSTFAAKTPKMAIRPVIVGAVKRPKTTSPDAATGVLVLERDHYSCASCGNRIGDVRGIDWTLQHRVARGMGGSDRSEINLAANLIVVCGGPTTPGGCHERIERRGAEDKTAGFWILRDTFGKPTDPATVPLFHALFGWCLIDNAGDVSLISEVAA